MTATLTSVSPVATLRLTEALNAVCPNSGVGVTTTTQPLTVVVHYLPEATDAQKTAAQGVIASFDWSEAADNAYLLGKTRQDAKNALVSTVEPTQMSARNTQRVIYASLVQTRMAVNQLIAWANSMGANLTPLQNRTWAQALQAVRAQIDAEGDPGV